MMGADQVEHSNPRSILESEEDGGTDLGNISAQAIMMNRVMFWILDGKDLVAVATRAYVAAYVASPDAVEGMTLNQIAKFSGCGRSMAHNLCSEFENRFEIRSVHARSDEARQNYSKAFHARNGTAPHAYNPLSPKTS